MPVIWLIDAYRAGERGQVRALVDALADTLGAKVETKVLDYRKTVFWPHLFGQSSLAGITPDAAASLAAPWPDLVVTCGVRNEPVCRWLKARSGGNTRYVHVGRPWGSLDEFDLVITTPQYHVPAHPNVLNNMLTLHSVTQQRLLESKAEWEPTFADLPRPYFAVMAGGDSGPFTFGPKAAARLGREASRMAQAQGGSLLVSTSSRTSAEAVDALEAAIDVPSHFYRWGGGDQANPYMGILACADRLIITGDSIAMLSEACATGKLVKIFDLGGMRDPNEEVERDFRLTGTLYAALMRWLWQPLSRDITLVHTGLRESGCAAWMGDVVATARVPAQSDLQRSVEAVRKLLD